MLIDSEVSEKDLDQIKMFLTAWPITAIKKALKEYALGERDFRSSQGWKLWTGEGMPGKPHEWKKIGSVIYYRSPPTPEKTTTEAAASAPPRSADTARKKTEVRPGKLICPQCGAEAFAQAVCPACAKGKAGIRRMYICGEDSNHIFYTE